MKEASVSGAVREEMAREKARIMRRKRKGSSLLEQVAVAWKRKKEKGKRAEQERKVQRGQQTPAISVQKVPAQARAFHNEANDVMQWKQYSSFKKEELESERLNEAGVWVTAKSLMAREWARALGRKTEDPYTLALEREAAEYREKKEEEKKRAAQERKRAEQQKERLQNSLEIFGERLLQEKGSITLEGTTKLFEKTLEDVGEVVRVSWKEDGCEAWIEPWEEKKLRRKRRNSLPVIYKLSINKILKIVSYERVNQPT